MRVKNPFLSISVGLCTYNGEAFLQKQLDSIAGQFLLPAELVACDDASTDGTVGILQSFAGNAPFPVRIHVNESNLGVVKNFEKVVNLCKGDYIALCDQDDVWHLRKLEKLYNPLKNSPGDGFAFCNAELIDEDDRSLNRTLWDERPNRFSPGERRKFEMGDQFPLFLKKNVVTGTCMMFASDLVPLITPFHQAWIHDYWIAAVAASCGYRGILVDEPLVLYRQHQSQQIGVLKGNWRSRIRPAFKKWGFLVDRDLSRINGLMEHLEKSGVNAPILAATREKREFLQTRAKLLRSARLNRFFKGAGMLIKGQYDRYSPYNGWTFIMDLMAGRWP